MEYYSAIKKSDFFFFFSTICNNMEDNMLGEISQKDRYHVKSKK